MERLRSLWRRPIDFRTWTRLQRLRAALVRLGIAGLIIAFIVFVVYIGVAYYTGVFPDPDWTGFGTPKVNADGQEIAHFKTLWDWLGLLLVPLVLAVGGYLLTRSENRYALQLQERREAEARNLETERAQDTALQAYLDQMTQLLLDKGLRASQPDDEVRSVARARTLTVLRVLGGGERPATVLQFLYEAKLIGGIKQEEGSVSGTIDAIVSLEGADLRRESLLGAHLRGAHLAGADLAMALLLGAHLDGANLKGTYLLGAHLQNANLGAANLGAANLGGAKLTRANLVGAHLDGANLTRAHLDGANLTRANLVGAKLTRADLSGADLSKADLTNCKVTYEQLTQAKSLEGAKLPFDMAPPAPSVEVAAQKNGATDLQETKPQGADLLDALLAGGATMPDGSKHE